MQPEHRPKDLSELELGFARQRAVRWLSPGVLVGTGVRVLLANIFGSYSDKRELQAVLPGTVHRHDPNDELWLDFVADVGDGFDATYSVASLLAAPSLDVDGMPLPRGQLLILGGDEVYPVASTRGYEDRTKGPYRAALPEASARSAPALIWASDASGDITVNCTSPATVPSTAGAPPR